MRYFGSLDSGDKQTIQEAADVIAKHTCIRFVERQDQEDYIEVYEDSKYDTTMLSFLLTKHGSILFPGFGSAGRGGMVAEL